MSDSGTSRRHSIRFSLRLLLVAFTAIAVWLGLEIPAVNRQAATVAMINRLNGSVWYESRYPQSIERLLGEARVARVVRVVMEGTQFTDSELRQLGNFPDLQVLSLANAGITDNGVQSLSSLSKLKSLNLMHCPITDAGLQYLIEMPNLQRVNLEGTKTSVQGARDLQTLRPELKIEHHFLD